MRKGVKQTMELLKRLVVEEDGQGLVEYTLIVLLVALVFWVAIKSTNIGSALSAGWGKVVSCVGDPSGCTSSS
jgi:Flp pilus assembly pilin Flp